MRTAGESQPLPTSLGLAGLYERMFLIRRFEEALLELFGAGKLAGTTHTCIGQEANAVGVASGLRRDLDVVVSNHRCHGHYLAFTDDVYGLLCEVMGRRDGVCGGRGGSQHLCGGNFYSNGVLGSTVPLATGIALAERERGGGAVVVVFLGDGALGQGVVYESLNIASLWRLPILLVLENNFYAQSTPSALALAGRIADRPAAFGMDWDELDSTDVVEIGQVAGEAIARVREGRRPLFLVLHTYRFGPHSKGDDFRDPAEVEAARERDPLAVAAGLLDGRERRQVEESCERRLADAILAAEACPPAAPACP